jgi:hypothetical protein
MPAIWTDADGRVERIHYNSEVLPDSQKTDAIFVDSIPDDSSRAGEKAQLYYDSSNWFHYEYTNHLDNLPDALSDSDKVDLYEAVAISDWDRVTTILNDYL